MKVLAVALVVACVAIIGASRTDAAAIGFKDFLKDCRLVMGSAEGVDGTPVFLANDVGDECGEYEIRGVSMVTSSGRYFLSGLDHDATSTHERFAVYGAEPEGFSYGAVDVYIPYRSRCDRYRLYADSAVRFVDSRPCDRQLTVKANDIAGGYRVRTEPGLRSVRASFDVTAGTCGDEGSIARHGLRISSHSAQLRYACDGAGDLHYRAEVVAAGNQTTVQRPTEVGDEIRVSITVSATAATTTVHNVTKGWTLTRTGPVGIPEYLSPARIGTFHYPGDPPLTQFAPVAYDDVTIGGHPLGRWTSSRVILTDSEGTVQVRPSTITNGESFTNTWKHS